MADDLFYTFPALRPGSLHLLRLVKASHLENPQAYSQSKASSEHNHHSPTSDILEVPQHHLSAYQGENGLLMFEGIEVETTHISCR